jgi:hypothetical protein
VIASVALSGDGISIAVNVNVPLVSTMQAFQACAELDEGVGIYPALSNVTFMISSMAR